MIWTHPSVRGMFLELVAATLDIDKGAQKLNQVSGERAQESAFNTDGPGGGQEMVEDMEEEYGSRSRVARRGGYLEAILRRVFSMMLKDIQRLNKMRIEKHILNLLSRGYE